MALTSGMLTSDSHTWETPQPFFDRLHAEFSFTLDACAEPANAKCERFFSVAENGLMQPWGRETVWMNPPYGRQIGWWVAKAFDESQFGATVVVLIPARTDTPYWHDYVMRASEVRLVRGRLRFGGGDPDRPGHNAPFPNAVVVFRPGNHVPRFSTMER